MQTSPSSVHSFHTHAAQPPLLVGIALALMIASPIPAAAIPLALDCNWNGMVHTGEAGVPDAMDGYRSITDRGLIVQGAPGNLGDFTSPTGLEYDIVSTAGTLDLLHIGTRSFDGSVDGDAIGVLPNWLPNPTQNTAVSSVASTPTLTSTSKIGILYQISNTGGYFDVTLMFSDASSVTVTLHGPDWYGNFNGTPAAPGPGVEIQQNRGTTFTATGNTDIASSDQPLIVTEAVVTAERLLADLGFNAAGKTLVSLTFGNRSNSIGGYGILAASELGSTFCGNTTVEAGEMCDDGNAADGDCCSSICQYETLGTSCTSDGDVCTDDVCDGAGTCEHPNGTASCNDGDACTLTDTCQAGVCVGANLVICTASDQCHAVGNCDSMTGMCSDPAKPNGSPCEDGQFCSANDSCSSGICAPGSANDCSDADACTADSCDEDMNVCLHAEIPRDPMLCYLAPGTKFQIKDSGTVGKDKLSWQWGKGDAFTQTDLGTPNVVMSTSYTLCVYDQNGPTSSLKASLDIAPSDSLWLSKDPKGLQYNDKAGTSEGVTKAQIKTGDATKTKVKVSARGSNLVLPVAASATAFFDQGTSVTVQLVNSAGSCWTSAFVAGDTKTNETDTFKAQTK